MIKTDQNADYYEGAMDCIDHITRNAIPSATTLYLSVLKVQVKKLWEDYYDRFAADHGQPVEEVRE